MKIKTNLLSYLFHCTKQEFSCLWLFLFIVICESDGNSKSHKMKWRSYTWKWRSSTKIFLFCYCYCSWRSKDKWEINLPLRFQSMNLVVLKYHFRSVTTNKKSLAEANSSEQRNCFWILNFEFLNLNFWIFEFLNLNFWIFFFLLISQSFWFRDFIDKEMGLFGKKDKKDPKEAVWFWISL